MRVDQKEGLVSFFLVGEKCCTISTFTLDLMEASKKLKVCNEIKG